MPFNVATFISQLQYDGARPNLFDVSLRFPNAVAAQPGQYVNFMVKAATLPGVAIGVASVPYFGRKIKLVGNKEFQSWPITVINDENFIIRRAFEQWSSALDSHEGNMMSGSFQGLKDYGTTATILQYGKGGQVIKEYAMIGCWPSSISAIDMAWDHNDVVEEFQVTLEYQYWESDTTDGSGVLSGAASAALNSIFSSVVTGGF